MRNMSFMLTTQQMRDGTKTVTRRLGWKNLKVGERVRACVKCQGLGKGGKIEEIGIIEIVSVEREQLLEIITRPTRNGAYEPRLEGFPTMTPLEFVTMFRSHMKCEPTQIVNRIEFKHVKETPNV